MKTLISILLSVLLLGNANAQEVSKPDVNSQSRGIDLTEVVIAALTLRIIFKDDD